MKGNLEMNSNSVHRLLNDIAGTTSRTIKIDLLTHNASPMLKKILKYAYDPNLKFHIKKIANPIPNYNGATQFDDKFFIMLDHLARRDITGDDAQRIAGLVFARLSMESRDLFLRILNKNLQCGISIKSINIAFPGLINHFEVMLAKQYDGLHVTFPCYVEPKIDGIRAIFKDGEFYTRTGKLLKGLDHLKYNCPLVLDGELYLKGITFEKLSGLVRNHQPTPEIQYHVFDCILDNAPYSTRRELYVDEILGGCSPDKMIPIRSFSAYALHEIENHYNFFIKSGYEGAVIKTIEHPYQFKRSWDWMKLKKRETVDVEVVAMHRGAGKYSDIMGYLACEYDGKIIRVGSGFSDAQREAYTFNPPIGKTIEVYFQELTEKGVLRHPIFKCEK